MSLVLSRKKEETIVFADAAGNEIGRYTVIDIRGDKVRMAHNFPKEVQVHRLEVWEAIKREKAATVPPC